MSMQQETILIYADVLERGRFFSKFYRPLQDEFGMDVMFLTARLSIVRMLKKFTENVAVLKHMDAENTMAEKIDYSRSLSVLNGYHSLSEAKRIGHAVYRQLEELSGRQKIKMIWIWNGTTTIAMTLAAFARDHGIATRFFEISNLGERIFVDRDGTSGASYLASHPELLDIVAVKEKEYHAWQEAYREHDKVPK
ncbi:MAG TPA: hypothetical protein ENL04_00155, partial [Sulfuricurvum sp.]|nr:hypothetical protein [Sulfuricurvum sp.]